MVFGLLLLLLPLETVILFYCHALSTSLLFMAHHFSLHYLQFEISDSETEYDFVKQQVSALLVHIIVASIVAYLLDVTSNHQRFMLAMYAFPVVVRSSGITSPKLLEACHNFSAAFMIIQGCFYISSHLPDAVNYYTRYVVVRLNLMLELYGWTGMFMCIWSKLFTPMNFLVFALVQMTTFSIQRFSKLQLIYEEGWHLVLLSVLGNSLYSPISLIAGCVFISYVSFAILSAANMYLRGNICFTTMQEGNIQHTGYTEGLTMMLLAMQTGLSKLKNAEKFAATGVILFIVASSLLQSVFEIAEPIVLEHAAIAYNTNPYQNWRKQIRAVSLSIFLLICPIYMTFQVMTLLPMDFWMMIIVSSCIMTSIQALNLIVTYSLFIYDSYVKLKPWEELDDIVYYCRATVRILEFFVAVSVVTAGIVESLSGNWNMLNSTILAVHCYFNVWVRFQSGWKSFLLRREASRKIDSLPTASKADLQNHKDVCAICYLEMKDAKITPCRHLFHGSCLRKWLYMQDNCPMCHHGINMTSDGLSELVPVH